MQYGRLIQHKTFRLWFAPLLLALLIFIASVIPVPETPPTPFVSPDKIVHIILYLLLAFSVARAGRPVRLSVLIALFLGVALYGLMLEGLQAFLPYRSAEGLDVAANAVGSFLGLGTYRLKNAGRREA